MESLRKLFNFKKKESSEATVGKSVYELRDVEEMLTKKVDFLETQIAEQTQVARAFGLRNKIGAKRALKKRGLLQKQLDQVSGMLTNVGVQIDSLSGVNINKSVIEALSDGAVALKAVNKMLDVDKVHDIMDQLVEQQDIGQEINDALTQFPGGSQDVDDEELDKELEALEQEELDTALLTIVDRSKEKVTAEDNDGQGGASGASASSPSSASIKNQNEHPKPVKVKNNLTKQQQSTQHDEDTDAAELALLAEWTS